MRVLVTGGAGFIGSALVRALHARGDEVVVVDDLSGGSAANLPGGVELVRQDVARPETAELVARLAPEAVVHAAAQVSVVRSQADPDRDRQVNLGGTQHVLDGARAAAVRRFVFVSSGGAVYGESDGASETDPPHPASYYAVHKLTAEHYVAMSGLAYAVARPANVYGPGQRSDLEGGVVAIFAQHLAAGAPVTIYGDGEQTRDFVNVEDVVAALVTMLDLPAAVPGGVWNVGTGEAVSVNQLLDRMEAAAGRSVERVHAGAREGEVRRSRLSIGLAERELGWRPRVSLDEGLRRVLAETSGDTSTREAGEA